MAAGLIIDRFDEVAARYADAPALDVGQRCYTYAELQDQARRFAAFLRSRQPKASSSEPRIVLNMPKSADYIIAVLGAFYAGWSFTPLEPSLPAQRRDFILDDIAPDVLVGAGDMAAALAFDPIEGRADYAADHLAYIIYTSGSTGTPKGVMLEHKGLRNVIDQQIKQFDIGAGDHSFLLLAISFDASLSDIFCALLSGACLHIAQGDKHLVASDLPQILNDRGITHIDIPPSMLRVLRPQDMPSTLRSIIIGGEVCPPDTVQKWAGDYLLNNVYGPTEASICTSMMICDPRQWDRPLIGLPMDHVEYRIKDGELLIGGVQLARGYWRRDDLTAEKFIIHDGQRFYRSGDHVAQHDDGHISFLGRLDRQVKIRGQLVELEEVEQFMLAHPDILRGIVVAPADAKGKRQLVAYYLSDQAMSENDLRDYMAGGLAAWMVPSRFIRVDEFPLTPSGKIDGKKLEAAGIAAKDQGAPREVRPPQNDRQRQIWGIWAEILKRDDFGIEDSFFALGGDSVDAIDFTLRAARADMAISPSMLSKHFTIADLDAMLARLADHTQRDQSIHVHELRKMVDVPPCPATIYDGGDAIFMTGATGFLGRRLLLDMLAAGQDQFICLVRAKTDEEALQRLDLAPAYHGRVQAVAGDFAQENFGLLQEAWSNLCKHTRSIIHCGAIVNMVKSFDDLRAANFDACREIMRLALGSRAAHIDYISTLSVFVSTDQNTGRVFEHDMLDNIGRVYGGYAQSKVAAELALHSPSFTNDCDVTSYRLGLITGDTKTGMPAAHDFLSSFIGGLVALGCVPDCDADHLMVDVTPVDYASRCLAHLILREGQKDDCYHIANIEGGGFSLRQIMEALARRGVNLRTIDAADWKALPQRRTLSAAEQAAWLGLCRVLGDDGYRHYRSMDLFQATDIIFDQTRLRAALGQGAQPPKADDDLLDLYISNVI